MILGINGIIATSRGITVSDADAQAFINSAIITDITQANAINSLVISLKSAGIWTKMKAIYPFVGGTANSHKFNLKDPRDLDAAYRLSFVGGGTHSATGYLPNGTTAYADTFLVLSTSGILLNSTHISYYSRTNTNTGIDIASQYITGDVGLSYIITRSGGTTYSRLNAVAGDTIGSNSDGRGFYLSSRINNAFINFYKNNIKTSLNQVSTDLPVRSLEIGALNYDNVRNFGSKECSFVSVGDGLFDADATNLYNAVQTFNTTLGRQV